MPNNDFIDARNEKLTELRQLIGTIIPGLIDGIPQSHETELAPEVLTAACDLLDAVRRYTDAPRQLDGSAAEAARKRKR